MNDTTHNADQHTPRFLLISIGNTNASCSIANADTLDSPRHIPLDNINAAAETITELAAQLHAAQRAAVAIASVNTTHRDELIAQLHSKLSADIYILGKDIPIPINHALTQDAIDRTGHDRLLAALAAYRAAKQAVVVVDAGTAITVDFVDGKGTFHGGAIAPGASTALRALHHATETLPLLTPQPPQDRPFGNNTDQAMLQGMKYGAQGLVRRLTERYAQHYDAYPMVVATGGDAPLLFQDDELIDRVVPHLTLRGIAIACMDALQHEHP